MNNDINTLCVKPDEKVDLNKRTTVYKGVMEKEEGKRKLKKLIRQLQDMQELLYADSGRSLLVVFQAMDAGGKDSTIRHVFGPLNPQGCRAVSFKAPTSSELAHDFLWRIHGNLPPRGYIGVFNRSHYEDVLVVKVKKLVPDTLIEKRYGHINNFERLLHDEGTRILKFYLHISKRYQKKRFVRRLEKTEKQWKFNPGDLAERKRWDDYMKAFEQVFRRCSTKYAPWYIIPAETRWFRDLAVATIVESTLQDMELRFPKPSFDPSSIVIP
ncbi:MAG: polyphosphate kinase 2 family protein [Spirochaetales bacterium]|nr:polyphosphate kinase 2 family protein [Spirochaetales bacterium]